MIISRKVPGVSQISTPDVPFAVTFDVTVFQLFPRADHSLSIGPKLPWATVQTNESMTVRRLTPAEISPSPIPARFDRDNRVIRELKIQSDEH
jgi:hypothetical protein